MRVTYHLTLVRFLRHWSTLLDAVDIKRPRSIASGILDEDQQGVVLVFLALEDSGGFRLGRSLELHTEDAILAFHKVISLTVYVANFSDLHNANRVTRVDYNGKGTLIIEGLDWVSHPPIPRKMTKNENRQI